MSRPTPNHHRSCALSPITTESVKTFAAIPPREAYHVLQTHIGWCCSDLSYHYTPLVIQMCTGCRVAELFDKDRWQKKSSGVWSLQPCKKGNVRLIIAEDNMGLPRLMDYWFSQDIMPISYEAYRKKAREVVKKCKLAIMQPHGRLECGCHIFRHIKAKLMYEQGYTPEQIAEYLGEKAVSSVDYYINSLLVTFDKGYINQLTINAL